MKPSQPDKMVDLKKALGTQNGLHGNQLKTLNSKAGSQVGTSLAPKSTTLKSQKSAPSFGTRSKKSKGESQMDPA